MHRLEQEGRHFWAQLHHAALNADVRRERDFPRWLQEWRKRLPFEGCPCEAHLDEYLRIVYLPDPRLAEYFKWSVDLHNDVNARIGKPLITLEAARKLWPPS